MKLTNSEKKERGLISVFAKVVGLVPGKTAVVEASGVAHTYKALDHYSDQIANRLYQLGIPTNKRIGICLARSYDTIAAMLAVLKVGCTYIPLAHDFPQSRLSDISRKAKLQLVISHDDVVDKVSLVKTVLNIDKERESIQADKNLIFLRDEEQSCPANVIFTSGTISLPKGVFVSQEGIINLVLNQNYANITSDDVLLQLSPFEFDGAALEMWGTLLNGATLVLIPPGYPVLSVIAEKIKAYGVSLLFITTQLFNLMVENRLEDLDRVKKILTGGEKASAKHMRRFIEHRCHNEYLANIYGPAECTTFSTYYPVHSIEQIAQTDNVPIGKALVGRCKLVVDADLNPVPQNTFGELLIGGAGVSEGYLDAPELTKEKFITRQYEGIPDSYFYRTGDKVFEDENGDVVYVGRYDKEIKVRGYRILPEEIEFVAMKYPGVSAAALTISEGDNGKYSELFISADKKHFSEKEFKAFLKQELPGYMHVNRLTLLSQMPLRANGKIDYERLR